MLAHHRTPQLACLQTQTDLPTRRLLWRPALVPNVTCCRTLTCLLGMSALAQGAALHKPDVLILLCLKQKTENVLDRRITCRPLSRYAPTQVPTHPHQLTADVQRDGEEWALGVAAFQQLEPMQQVLFLIPADHPDAATAAATAQRVAKYLAAVHRPHKRQHLLVRLVAEDPAASLVWVVHIFERLRLQQQVRFCCQCCVHHLSWAVCQSKA